MRFPSRTALLFLTLLVALPAAAFAQDTPPAPQPDTDPVTVTRRVVSASGATVAELSNGMTVIVRAIRTAPVVSVRAYVRAGGIYEREWLGCGLSHLLEHLVAGDAISGADGHHGPKLGEGIGRAEKIGGQANAYTSLDHTCYYIAATSAKTTDCIDLILDQVTVPEIAVEDFRREHQVVQRELEMGKDNPSRILYYAHQANLYRTHPAAVPTIGYAKPLAEVTYEDITAYHKRMYQPQNMIVAVVGDIDTDKALEQVVAKVQDFRRGRTVEYTLPKVPPVSGISRVVQASARFRETAEMMSFATIPLIDDDLYPLDVLSTILSRGQASRLVKTIQLDKKLVTSIDTWSSTPNWGRGAFTFTFRCEPAKADAAEQAILDELREVIANGVTAQELQRAQQQMVADFVRGQQAVDDIAGTMARDLMMTGDLAFSANYTKRVQAVTTEHVLAVAKKYFRFDDRVITRVIPADYKAAHADADQSRQEATTEVYKLPNGLTVVLKPSDAVGLSAMALSVPGGILTETPETNGLGRLMMAMSTRGAGDWSGDEIAEFFAGAGGGISATAGDNSYLYQASVLAESFAPALERFAAVALAPTFPEKELDSLRPRAMSGIRQLGESWTSQLRVLFRKQFFRDSPWSMVPQGRLSVVRDASVAQLKAFYAERIRAEGAVLAVTGNFDPAATKELVAKHFQQMPTGKAETPKVQPRKIADGGERYVMKSETKQAGIMVARPAMTMADTDDRLALTLMDTIVSGYRLPSGWLHAQLRGAGAVYVVHAYIKTGRAPGAFLTYAGTQPPRAQKVIDVILENMTKAATYLPTQDELDLAANTVLTADVLGKQTVEDIAVDTALNVMYGLGPDWTKELDKRLHAITPEQVQAAAKKYLDGPFVVTVITPQPDVVKNAELLAAENVLPGLEPLPKPDTPEETE